MLEGEDCVINWFAGQLGLEDRGLVPNVAKKSLALGSRGRFVENSELGKSSPSKNECWLYGVKRYYGLL